MTVRFRLSSLGFFFGVAVLIGGAEAFAQTSVAPNAFGDCSVTQFANCDGSPDQAMLEASGTSGAQSGNWDDLPGGASTRPYVKRLSLTNGGSEVVLLENGTPSSALSNVPGSVGVIISPINLCDSTETPENPSSPGRICYSSPNRIQVTVSYRKGVGQVGSNLSAPNDGTTSGNLLPTRSSDGSQTVTLDENTTIDLTLALNTLGSTLRWTWVNGVPSFWSLTSLGQPEATARIKFRPAPQPAIHFQTLPPESFACSAIPVLQCDLARSSSDWLSATMILSLDTTLSAEMTGALFATEGAIIGSVDYSLQAGSSLPQLVYGLASSHEDYTGATRVSTLRAFIPAASLVQALGMPSFTDASVGSSRPADLISIARVGASAAVNPTFSVWREASNGSNGLFITVPGITFSAPQYNVTARNGVPSVPSVGLSKGQYSFTLRGKTSGALAPCRREACTVTLYRAATSDFSSKLTRVATRSAEVTSSTLSAPFVIKKSASIKKNTRLLAVITGKKRRVLASTPIVLQR